MGTGKFEYARPEDEPGSWSILSFMVYFEGETRLVARFQLEGDFEELLAVTTDHTGYEGLPLDTPPLSYPAG